jgi:hypothetical protein
MTAMMRPDKLQQDEQIAKVFQVRRRGWGGEEGVGGLTRALGTRIWDDDGLDGKMCCVDCINDTSRGHVPRSHCIHHSNIQEH